MTAIFFCEFATAGDPRDLLLYQASRTWFTASTSSIPSLASKAENMDCHSPRSKALWQRDIITLFILLMQGVKHFRCNVRVTDRDTVSVSVYSKMQCALINLALREHSQTFSMLNLSRSLTSCDQNGILPLTPKFKTKLRPWDVTGKLPVCTRA